MSAEADTLKRLTVRMPEPWRGKITDGKLQSWLRSIPQMLPPDPGGGTFRRSFALSTADWERVQQHARILKEDPSAWLRRLIAAKLGGHAPSPAILSSRSPASVSRSAPQNIVKPVPSVRRTARADLRPYSEDEGKRAFQKYIEELENMIRSGRPEAGEAQIRLAQIRKASRTPSS